MESGLKPLRCALAQIDATVGDIEGNRQRILDSIRQAGDAGAALLVLPELALTGYPPEDLLLKRHFLDDARSALDDIAARTQGIVVLLGFPEKADHVYNSAAVIADRSVVGIYRKMRLPNYGVFDERRYFAAGDTPLTVDVNGVRVGITICEDIWEPGPPASVEARAGAPVIVNLSASPYHRGKGLQRERMLARRARDNLASILFCNAVGGQDELVFDGHSVAIDHTGEPIARAPQFEEALTLCTIDPRPAAEARLHEARSARPADGADGSAGARILTLPDIATPAPPTAASAAPDLAPMLAHDEEVYRALATGLRSYVEKNGFRKVVFGLSGGIDSALVALIAADALGPERVAAVVMPSPHSSAETQEDARAIARNLGTGLFELPIDEPMAAFDSVLADVFAGREPDLAEENLQARIRGNLLMALSNKFGVLVLTTGNKSELSVGYSTLYGDMAGGFAVLKDVFKGTVYRLVRWRNAQARTELIPASVIDRAPTAELRADQRDDQSLPPYEQLDAILEGYVEQDLDAAALVARGFPAETVEQVIRLVDGAEHKRRQAPPGVRISTKAFGRDRRLPITNRYGKASLLR